jgi:hypothetical protein
MPWGREGCDIAIYNAGTSDGGVASRDVSNPQTTAETIETKARPLARQRMRALANGDRLVNIPISIQRVRNEEPRTPLSRAGPGQV